MKRLVALIPAAAAIILACTTRTLAGIPDHPAVTVGPAPPWVVVHEITPAVPNSPRAPAAEALDYLGMDYQIKVDGVATEEYARTVYRVDTQSGLESGSQYEITFDPAFSKVIVHHLKLYRDGLWHDRLDEAFGSIAQRETDFGWRIYDGSLSILMVMDDVRVSDVISIAYTVSGHSPVFDGRFFHEIRMGWSAPVAWRRVRVLSPADRGLDFRVFGEELPDPSVRPVGDGWTEYLWGLEDIAAYDSEGWIPDDWDSFPWLQLTQYRSWNELAAWALPLYSLSKDPGLEIAEAAASITAGTDNEVDRVSKAIRWIQDEIRYFGIELGAYSHAPHPPHETLRRRYGDCKDKSLLLVALLREIGFEAWPVLIDTVSGRALPQRLPSPGVFNHVIVLARVNDRDLWIDPTLSLQGGPLDALWVPDYRWGLIVRPGETQLTPLPQDNSDPGSIRAEYDYLFEDGEKPCTVTVNTIYAGRQAEVMRRRLTDSTLEELQESFARYYSAGNARAVPTADLEVSDERQTNLLTMIESYKLEDWWYVDQENEYFDLFPLMIFDVLLTSDDPDRRAPIAIPRRARREERVIITPPSDWDLEPINAAIQRPWFRYRVEGAHVGSSLNLDYEFETFDQNVAAADVGAYNAAIDIMNDDLIYTIFRPVGDARAAHGGTRLTMPSVWVMLAAVTVAGSLIVGSFLWMLGRLRWM
jgi:hypothetical protein